MKKSRFLEFFLFLGILASLTFHGQAAFFVGTGLLLMFGLVVVLGHQRFQRALRRESADFSTFFAYFFLRHLLCNLSASAFAVAFLARASGGAFDIWAFLYFFVAVTLLPMLPEAYAYFRRLRVHRLIRFNLVLRLGFLVLSVWGKASVWELGLLQLVLTLPDLFLLGLEGVRGLKHASLQSLYRLRFAGPVFFFAVALGYVQVKASVYPQSSSTAYLALALKSEKLMNRYLDHGGDANRIIEFGQRMLLGPALIHQGMYGSLEHLRKRGIDFSSQNEDYVLAQGQDVLIPIALKDDVRALELVEHLPIRYDLRYTINHSNILHFVSSSCAPKVAEIILPKIKREMLYEADAHGVTPLTSAADSKCQAVLDVYAKLSPNWNHTDRRGRSVASIRKSASMLVREDL